MNSAVEVVAALIWDNDKSFNVIQRNYRRWCTAEVGAMISTRTTSAEVRKSKFATQKLETTFSNDEHSASRLAIFESIEVSAIV